MPKQEGRLRQDPQKEEGHTYVTSLCVVFHFWSLLSPVRTNGYENSKE